MMFVEFGRVGNFRGMSKSGRRPMVALGSASSFFGSCFFEALAEFDPTFIGLAFDSDNDSANRLMLRYGSAHRMDSLDLTRIGTLRSFAGPCAT